MAPMVKMRAVPTALRSATARGEHQFRHSIRAIQTRRNIATNATVRDPSVEFPGGVPPVPVPQRRSALEERIAAVHEAKPFSDFLTDTFHRQHDYLRISITERCNLRCLYCMPEEGIPLSPNENMLTTPEIFYLSSLFVSQGVTKIRLTGGEPTIRRDIIPLMQRIGSLRPNGLRELALTTNGITLHRKLDAMVESGLTGVNLSLDTLDPFQFQIMTRRKGFDAVMKSIDRILEMNKLGANVKLKVNCVVMRGLNEREILPFVELGREKEIEVRFIEYMPFGGNKWSEGKMIGFQEMLDIIRTKYPDLRRVPGHKNDTSKTFEVPGFVGKVGFITSMTNDFCGSCNRLRITSDGNLKVCLHGNAEVSLRDVLRQGNDGRPIDEAAFERIKQLEMDRHEGRLSDETILGWGSRERELLDVIGAAVKRKAEKHADMGDLKNMTNRPMILIDKNNSAQSSFATRALARHIVQMPTLPLRTSPALPRSSYSFLSATLPSSTSSVRAYHQQSLSVDNDSIEQIELPTEEDTEQPIDVYGLKKSERVLLKAVWENGLSESHRLPESVEKVRQKYDMTGREYDHYWRLAAGSLTSVLHNNAKARRKLRNIESQKEKSGEYSIVPKRKEGGISSHGALMREAIWLSKTMRGFPVAETIPSQRAAELQHARDREQTPKQVAVLQNAVYQRLEAQKKAARKEAKASYNYRSVMEGPRHGQRLASTSEQDSASNTKVEMNLGGLQDARDRKSPPRKKGRNDDDYSAVLENLSYSHKLVSSSNTKDRDHRSGSTQRSEEMVSRPRRKTQNGEDCSALLEDISQAQRPVSSLSTKSMDGDIEPSPRLESKQEVSNDGPPHGLEVGREEDSDNQEIQRQIEGLFDDMEKHPPIVWSPDTMDNISSLSLNKNDEHKEPKAKRAQNPKTQDEQLLEDEARKAERRKKLRELSQQRIELQKKRDELKEKLRLEKEEQRQAKKARDEAPLLAWRARIDKEASSDLGDVLDIAMERNLERNRPMRNRELPIRRIQIEGLPSMGSRSIKLDSADLDIPEEAQEQNQDTVFEPVHEQSTRPSNDLYLHVPSSGEIPIDFSLTLTLNSDKSTLQSQVRAMQSRLSASYPRIDALPYNIAESENKQTLRTWLKVLAGRWQSRFDDRQDTAHFDPQLKAVLDQLVRDHDLSNDAAIRMAEKWIDIFERRSAKTSDVEEELDDEETEAGGMSFLRGSEEEVEAVVESGEKGGDESGSQIVETSTGSSLKEREVAVEDFEESVVELPRQKSPEEEQEAVSALLDSPISQEASSDTKLPKQRRTKDQETTGEESDESVGQDGPNDSNAKDPSTRKKIPIILPSKPTSSKLTSLRRRLYSTSSRPPPDSPNSPSKSPSLPHLTPTGSAHMVSVSSKAHTTRTAIAIGTVHFSNATPLELIQSNSLKKGDVLSVSRIAGIMAAKKCPDLIPLCHPIALTHVGVELQVFSQTPLDSGGKGKGFGGVNVEAKVECTGQTGVEMEALTSVMGTALSVMDMCKAVDKGMVITDVRVVVKEGGRSGVWREKGWVSWQK